MFNDLCKVKDKIMELRVKYNNINKNTVLLQLVDPIPIYA